MAEVSFARQVPDQPPNGSTHRLVLRRGEHRWNFCWDPGSEAVLINSVAALASRYQSGADCPFDWLDAAVACHHIARSALGVPSSASNQDPGRTPQQAR